MIGQESRIGPNSIEIIPVLILWLLLTLSFQNRVILSVLWVLSADNKEYTIFFWCDIIFINIVFQICCGSETDCGNFFIRLLFLAHDDQFTPYFFLFSICDWFGQCLSLGINKFLKSKVRLTIKCLLT